MRRYAVLIDLQSIRLGANMFRRIYDDLTREGSIEYIKFYNYNTKRHRELRSIVSEYNVSVDLPIQGKSRVRIDIREVMDAVRIASSVPSIDTFFIVSAEVDGVYLIDMLKSMGKYIVMGVTSRTSLSERAHEVYIIDRMEELSEEIAIASNETPSMVKGDRDSIFPFSDVESSDISDKMSEIDRRLLSMIDKKSINSSKNITSIFGKH